MTLSLALLSLARLLLGGAFLVIGIRNVAGLDGLTAAMKKRGLPQPRIAMTIGVGIQILGGLAVATGVFSALGALALIFFVVAAAILFHNFWAYPADQRGPHVNAWIMNAGWAGAFLTVLAFSI